MGFLPTDFEQLQFELINLLRTDPSGEFVRLVQDGSGVTPQIEAAISYFGVDLSALEQQLGSLSAVAPLAWNRALADAADYHTGIMIQHDSQTHQAPGEPTLRERTVDAGYTSQSYLGENVYAFTEDPLHGHAGFVIDWGFDADDDPNGDFASAGDGIQDPAGHRISLMHEAFFEVGVGAAAETDLATDVGPYVVTQNFGGPTDYAAQFLGVVVADLDEDGFYDIGEGLGGVAITLQSQADNSTLTTTSWDSGGWQIAAPAGTYTITFSGGGLEADIELVATLAGENVKVDAYTTGPFPPIARDDAAEGQEDAPLRIDVLANDFDREGGALQVDLNSLTDAANGTVSLNSDGTLTYTPKADFFGSDSFAYTVIDPDGLTATASVSVVIQNVEDAPVAQDDAFTLTEDSTMSFALLANDIDADSDTLAIVPESLGTSANGSVTLNADGSVSYTPTADFFGTDEFVYRVTDGKVVSDLARVVVTVTSVNDAPTLDFDPVRVLEENAQAGALAGSVQVQDDATGTVITLEGDWAEAFYLDDDNHLRVAEGANLDFESEPEIELSLVATDAGGLVTSLPVSFALRDVFDQPATSRDDVLTGTDGDDDIDGGAGDDFVRPGAGADHVDVGQGMDTVAGTLAELAGDVITGFAHGDRILLVEQSFSRGQMFIERGSRFGFDADGDSRADGWITLGDAQLSAGDLMLVRTSRGTELEYVDFLPALADGVQLEGALINGISSADYLAGANSPAFEIEIEASGAGFGNSLGVYEVDGDGNISGVRFLSANVKDDLGNLFTVDGIEEGSSLGFFIVQDGANRLSAAVFESAELSISLSGGKAELTDAGAAVSGATIFVSHDHSLNIDGAQHAVSGISSDGNGSLQIGFEDLLRDTTASDDDFQDLVIDVLAVEAGGTPTDATGGEGLFPSLAVAADFEPLGLSDPLIF